MRGPDDRSAHDLGVLLAIFEQVGIIQAFQGKTNLSVGTVAAGRSFLVEDFL